MTLSPVIPVFPVTFTHLPINHFFDFLRWEITGKTGGNRGKQGEASLQAIPSRNGNPLF